MDFSDFDLSQQNNSTESKIIISLERISQAFKMLLWEESKKYSLSPIQIQILIFLLYHHPQKRKVSYLAREFNLSKATISSTIKTLDQKQLIQKEFEEFDSRSFVINLTERGKEIAQNTAGFTKKMHAPLHQMDQDKKEDFLLNLYNIIDHLRKSGVISIQRMCSSCLYYKKTDQGNIHFCKLLNQELKITDLKLDCPEYEVRQRG